MSSETVSGNHFRQNSQHKSQGAGGRQADRPHRVSADPAEGGICAFGAWEIADEGAGSALRLGRGEPAGERQRQGVNEMNRTELKQFIMENYSVEADYPWLKHPNFEVFRHSNNQKWFALIMDVPKDKLGLRGTEPLDVVNFKCDPILIGSLRGEPGIFPAYHMNKEQWLTAALDGSVSDEQIKMLLDMSYEATASKK